MPIWGRRKDERPPGEGVGPTYDSPNINEGSPSTIAGDMWAPPAPYDTEAIWNTVNHYDYPPLNVPPSHWARYHNDPVQLYPLEQSNATEQQNVTWRKRRGADPRWNPPEPSRPPRVPVPYRFFRQYSDTPGASAHEFNSTHFSMAEYRRDYPIGGMRPATRNLRNTYRLTPADGDENSVDQVPTYRPPSATYDVNPTMNTPNRSYRL